MRNPLLFLIMIDKTPTKIPFAMSSSLRFPKLAISGASDMTHLSSTDTRSLQRQGSPLLNTGAIPTKFSLAHGAPFASPTFHRAAPCPPETQLLQRQHRSNHLLSPLDLPGKKGLWTVTEDEEGELEAELEDHIRRGQCASLEQAMSRWTLDGAENRTFTPRMRADSLCAEGDSLVDIDLMDHSPGSVCSLSTSCTSEDSLQWLVTPENEIQDPLDDVFIAPTAITRTLISEDTESVLPYHFQSRQQKSKHLPRRVVLEFEYASSTSDIES